MASTKRTPCIKCGANNAFIPCEGCDSWFCARHFGEHRTELSTQLQKIGEHGEHLKKIFERHEVRQDHPLFSQISVWEHDAISRIQSTAQVVRDQLREHLKQSADLIRLQFAQVKTEVDAKRERDDFLEADLEQLREQLKKLKKQMETPSDTALVPDTNSPPIHLMKLSKAEEVCVVHIPLPVPTPVKAEKDADDCSKVEEPDPVQAIMPGERVTVNEEAETPIKKTDELPHPSIFVLDPKKNQTVLLLNRSTPIESSKLAINFTYFLGDDLQIFNNHIECVDHLTKMEQVTVFIDQFPSQTQQDLLQQLSQCDRVHSVYIRGDLPKAEKDREDLFTQCPTIRGMCENEQRLIAQWAMDSAAAYKTSGDVWLANGDKTKSRDCFERGIRFYQQLAAFMREQQRAQH